MTADSDESKISGWWQPLYRYLRRDVIPVLADLRLAIALLLAIAGFSIIGTVIEQGESTAFYQANYPEDPALFGFLSWKVLLNLGLDHVYRTWWFLALLILFGASLTACTFTRQFPALKAARRWRFYQQPRQFEKLALSTDLATHHPQAIALVRSQLHRRRYAIFSPDGADLDPAGTGSPQLAETSDPTQPDTSKVLYARKGIVGRIGPIVVHASMLLILGGAIWGAMTGFYAQEKVPSGQTFRIQHIFDAGPWAAAQIPRDWSVRVNRFWIDYTPAGLIDQFYSDLSVLDDQGEERDRQTIHVNKPLRYRNVTLYQADWGIAAVQVQFNRSPVLELPMRQLELGGVRTWGTWVPTNPTDVSQGVALLAQDLQGTVLVYNDQGQLVSTVRAGMSIQINDVTLKVVKLIGSTGLQIKADPGIPAVYTGFGLLMIGVVMSYVSHSQIWVLQQGDRLYLGGRTNRAQVTFERELIEIFDDVQAQLQEFAANTQESPDVSDRQPTSS